MVSLVDDNFPVDGHAPRLQAPLSMTMFLSTAFLSVVLPNHIEEGDDCNNFKQVSIEGGS